MAELPQVETDFTDFLGLLTNQDPRDLMPGYGQDQRNACVLKASQLLVRRGYRQLTFEDGD